MSDLDTIPVGEPDSYSRGLMDAAYPSTEYDTSQPSNLGRSAKSEDLQQVDSDLVYNAVRGMLAQDGMPQQLVQTLSQAKNIPEAVGNIAGMLVMRTADEFDKRGMPVATENLLGEKGGLAKSLTAVYEVVNKAGFQLPMEDSIVEAFEYAQDQIEAMEDEALKEPVPQPQQTAPISAGGLL